MEQRLYLVIGKDSDEIQEWMCGYVRHWKHRKTVYEPDEFLLIDTALAIDYRGIDGSRRNWRRQVQHTRPDTVILLRGWTEVQGLGMELDLLKAVGAKIVFSEPFEVIR